MSLWCPRSRETQTNLWGCSSPRGGRGCCFEPSRRRRKQMIILLFFIRRRKSFVAFFGWKRPFLGSCWREFVFIFRFLPIVSHFNFFGAFSFCTVGTFFGYFSDMFRICSDFLPPPPLRFISQILGANLPILTTFGPFWTIFGRIKKWLFFAENGFLAQV